MNILKFKNISYRDGDNIILDNISFEVNAGDFISIVGPSGSGKSTLLKLCSHLKSPTLGTILFNGEDISKSSPSSLRKDIAYCFQTPYLFGDTVSDNLSFPYSIRDRKVDMERINYLLSIFNIDKDFFNKTIINLSGGEKQRVALIRTLLFEPKIILLDEVTSALDVDNTLTVENVIRDLNNTGLTILWVTHNPEQSKKHANKILTLENGKISSLEVIK